MVSEYYYYYKYYCCPLFVVSYNIIKQNKIRMTLSKFGLETAKQGKTLELAQPEGIHQRPHNVCIRLVHHIIVVSLTGCSAQNLKLLSVKSVITYTIFSTGKSLTS